MPEPEIGRQLFLTYTCPVSRFTYAGHPSRGTLYEHTNDLHDAVSRIKAIATRHGQPVSWVINDQEYLNVEGMLPRLLEFQAGGDSVLVTMELTTSPSGVDKRDTSAVVRWINERCKDAGLAPDGLWSLKFFESDLKAISELPSDEFGWTRNLAGSCWAQEGIDDSTWLGCPYGPYFPALWNSKCPAGAFEPAPFLMLEWLTRDITAIASGGFPATFSLDPADANRKDAGGFADEQQALRYSVALMDEAARQVAFNRTVTVNINEEARHYQTEGHDKDLMLDGMFGRFSEMASSPPQGVDVRQAAYSQVWKAYRERYRYTPRGVFLAHDLDWRSGPVPGASEAYQNRIPGDTALLYQSIEVQALFLRSRGPLPVQLFDYTSRTHGADSNDPYPARSSRGLSLRQLEFDETPGGLDVSVTIASAEEGHQVVALWGAPARGDERLAEDSEAGPDLVAAVALPQALLLHINCRPGVSRFDFQMQRGEQ